MVYLLRECIYTEMTPDLSTMNLLFILHFLFSNLDSHWKQTLFFHSLDHLSYF